MAEHTEAEVIRDLTRECLRVQVVTPSADDQAVYRTDGGRLEFIDLETAVPNWKSGTVTVRDVASFAAYFAKHADDDSEIYADLTAATITAVLDAHHSADFSAGEVSGARWEEHRLTLALETTLPWKTWLSKNRTLMTQTDFAEFIEDNYRDIASRPATAHQPGIDNASLLELAQTFQASTKTEFVSAERLSSGEVQFVMKETTTASGGRDRKIDVPQEFDLTIAPYEDCSEALIAARFRYRKNPGLQFMYVLNNPERHRQEAVKEITGKVAEATGRKIMLGAPAE
jgi:uncharacterized protein YfdQ (DUF2303 family)